MVMTSVNSTNISAVGYDGDSSTLQIEFNNGTTYQYFDVPEDVFTGLRDADSVGGYLADVIKGAYRYSKV